MTGALFDTEAFDGHEEVHFFHDAQAGLRAIIALHSTVLGPAGGGIRMWPYASDDLALRDVLRLSKAMTFKMALAGVALGGGKSVIIADPARDKSEALFRAFGRAVDSLGGRYICAEDVGTTPEDMVHIDQETDHVVGLPGKSGDTSPLTGRGIFRAIEAAARHRFGSDDLNGRRVAVQGCGNVARHLMGYLKDAGAAIVAADISETAAARAAQEFGAEIVAPDALLAVDADVLAPCALGGILDDASILVLRARIVCGGANNQLAEDRHGRALHEAGILYVPDYAANSGGVFSASREALGGGEARARAQVDGIGDTVGRILERAEADGTAPSEAADAIARGVIAAAKDASIQ